MMTLVFINIVAHQYFVLLVWLSSVCFRNNSLVHTCKAFGRADDMTMGGIITMALNIPLTESYLFHSVYDQIPPDSNKKDEEELKNQVRVKCFHKISTVV